MMDGISVIIPTLNRTDFVVNTINDVLQQDFDKSFEIIVVDQSNTADETVQELATKHDIVHYYHITSFRGLPEARNFGWQHASFDYLLYIDDDIEIDSNLLKEHYHYLEKPNIGIVAGGILERNNPNPLLKRTGYFNYHTATPIRGFNSLKKQTVDHAPGGNFSIKKDLMRLVGGSDEMLNVGAALYEETDLCLRVEEAGFLILFNPKAHVIHLVANTGGCRIKDIDKYIYSLSHNRSIIISRHLRIVHQFTAVLYLIKIVLSYSLAYRKFLFPISFRAFRIGWKKGKQMTKCTNYINE